MKSFISLEESISILNDNVKHLETEEVNLINGTKRVLAEDIYSIIDNPPFNKSAMDGYAIIAEDSWNSPITLLPFLTLEYSGDFSL